jgi:lipopolysaccharide biosynthesis regulator YciM
MPTDSSQYVTLADFNRYDQAARKYRAAQQKNNEASLVAIQLAQAGVVENRRKATKNTEFIQTITEQNVKFVGATKDALEVLVTRTQSNREAIKMMADSMTKFLESTLKIVEGKK